MKKLISVISILLIFMFPITAFADSEDDMQDTAEIVEIAEGISASEDLPKEDITPSDGAPEASLEPAPESIDAEISVEEISEETNADIPAQEEVVPEEVPEDAATHDAILAPDPQGFDTEDAPEPEEACELPDEEDFETFYEEIASYFFSNQAPEVDIRKFNLKAEDRDELACYLGLYFDEFELVERNGYIVAVLFFESDLDEEDEETEGNFSCLEDSGNSVSSDISYAAAYEEKKTMSKDFDVMSPYVLKEQNLNADITFSKSQIIRAAEENAAEEPDSSFIGTLILIIGFLRRILSAL